MLNSIENNTTIRWRLIKNLPCIGKELIKNKLKQITSTFTITSKKNVLEGSGRGKYKGQEQ